MPNYSNNYQFIRISHGEHTKQIPLNVAQKITGRSIKTLKRWINQTQQPDDTALELLRIYAFGLPPLIDPGAWKGFFFKNKGYGHKCNEPVLVTPYDDELTANDILNLMNTYNLNTSLMKQNKELKNYVKKLEDAKALPGAKIIAFEPYLRRKEFIDARPHNA